MPNRNRMGPHGLGSKTGRGMGLCGATAAQTESGLTAGGMGRGWCGGRGGGGGGRGGGRGGGGGGRGFANWTAALGEKMRAGLPFRPTKRQPASVETEADREDLVRQAEWLREQLRQVEERLNIAAKE